MKGKIIQFIRSKDFKFIEEIGQGGTGRTVLLEDEIINERFVCKKYSPFYEEHKKLFFNNFKDEIKLLHLLNHKNIVRVFNYYLYPEEHTGYILMEFIKGQNISNFLKDNPDKLNDTFRQTINGFVHLEKSNILHRDIRPDNILISKEGIVKIIDFGFSKKIDFESDFDKSISLNWRYSPPNDFQEKKYDFRTELYFLGKLFEEIIKENDFQNFRYKDLLKDMVNIDYLKRTPSFFDLNRKMISELTSEITFTKEEKKTYQNFADGLESVFSNIDIDANYITDISEIIREVQEVHRNSILEDNIQNQNRLARCFIKGNFRYWKNREIKVDTVYDFSKFLISSSKERQKVILNNLWQRLDKIERHDPSLEDDLPF
ncbi:protein kinase family protein [Aquimarina pacifica]|uniref:protein kinase family protein n=1 Tax=Aquimarina pacifica TaxID=1296415 RepID=UPI0004723AC9|nr:protein kinase family protein [Aquimarina pacifica]